MTTIDRGGAALAELRAGFAGEVILPEDPSYEAARTIFNAMIDRRPAVIAQCENTADIAQAICFGREHELEIAVRAAADTASPAWPCPRAVSSSTYDG